MRKAIEIIKEVKKQTDSVILFHSLSGKDSITLLDLLYPRFKRVVCVYMYVVKDLRHQGRYLAYAKERYPKAQWLQVPHYGLLSDIKSGYLGHQCNPKQRQYTLAQLTDLVRERTGVEWACFGSKKADSLNRRLMLGTYRLEGICDKTKKFYPLSSYVNRDVLRYIQRKGLIEPENYDGVGQSAGIDVGDTGYLLWLRKNYPDDLQRVYHDYPFAERLIFEYDHEKAEGK